MDQAMRLLEDAISGRYRDAELSVHTLKHFIQLGASVGFIHISNADMLLEELNAYNSAIAGLVNTAKIEATNLEGIFSSPRIELEKIIAEQKREEAMVVSDKKENGTDKLENEQSLTSTEEENIHGGQALFKIAMRHSAILSKIRQSGNCRIKDIQEVLPEISERTLRYDLQKLSDQGLIERIGSGGPATYYKMRL